MFKLLAIRPLEGCADYIQKCLKTGMMYYFCNDYIIEPGSHIRRRSKNIKPLKEDFFTMVSESDYYEENSSERKSPTVSVSAIVGMNGDGKSSLVELMMRLVNNCAISYMLSASSDSLRRVKGVKAELYYIVDNVIYRMAEEGKQNKTQIWEIAEVDDKNGEIMRWDMKPNRIKHVDKDTGCFFFTIVSNYSHYAYNIYDYKNEWEIRGGEKDDDEKCWLHYIFHKSDDYLTPITLHPVRDMGNFDINNEKSLSRQRILLLFLNADNPSINEHSFRRVKGKDANTLKLTGETESILQQRAIVEFFEKTNNENRFEYILEMIDKILEETNQVFENSPSIFDKVFEKYERLIDSVLPKSFMEPINEIIEQDDFDIFVREVINSIITNNHLNSDISSIIKGYNNLVKKTEDIIAAIKYNKKGLSYVFLGDNDLAIVAFGKAIELIPNYANAYNNRGTAYSNKGEYEKAMGDFNKAIMLSPTSAEFLYNRGNIYCKEQNYEAAISDYTDAIHAIKINPMSAEAYCSRGDIYAIIGQYNKAISDYEMSLRYNAKDAKTYNNRGNAYFYEGDYKKAMDDYNTVVEMNPKYGEAYYNRGNTYFNMGEYIKAVLDYNKAIELDTKNPEVYYNLGNTHFNLGDFDKAIQNYNKVIDLCGISKERKDLLFNAYNNQGNTYCKIKEYEMAIRAYTIALNYYPECAVAYFNRGKAYFIIDKRNLANDDFRKALSLNSTIEKEFGNNNVGIEDIGIGKESVQMDNAKSIQLSWINNYRKNKRVGIEDGKKALEFHLKHKKYSQWLFSSIQKYWFISCMNATQLGRLDTLYRISRFYNIDLNILSKDYSELTIEEKCQQFIVYETWNILFDNPQYQKAKNKDGMQSLREFGPKMEECIEEIKNDHQSIGIMELRQVENYMQEGFQNGNGLYERLGTKDEETGNLLVSIDELKTFYGVKNKSFSLYNLPPPIYKWDVLFKKRGEFSCDLELDSFSSGEKQMLNSLGAIIYYLQNLANTSSKVKYCNVNLVLEEIELYYHPEYQRVFLDRLLNLVKGSKLDNIQNISVVFVTHSPFILSDIPKCNVLFLRDGMPKDIMQENTFGANIHTLLKNGFFMPNLPIGEFAYGKINKLFGKLNSGDLNPNEDLDDIYQEILLVGEPFLRNQLLLLYNSYKGSCVMPVKTNKKGIKS